MDDLHLDASLGKAPLQVPQDIAFMPVWTKARLKRRFSTCFDYMMLYGFCL